jgi:hypothetical protein
LIGGGQKSPPPLCLGWNHRSQSSVGKRTDALCKGFQEETMRPSDLRAGVGRTIRGGIVALGLVALSVSAAVIQSSDDAYARGDGSKGDGKGGKDDGGGRGAASGKVGGGAGAVTESGRGANTSANAKGRAGMKTRGTKLGIFGGLFSAGTRSGSTSSGIGFSGGHAAFGMDTSGVRESFESLTKAQQARVMQRCKDVIANPAQANTNQLALCQTLVATAKR